MRTEEPGHPLATWSLTLALIAILAWAPLPLGSNRTWSVGILAMALAAMMPLATFTYWHRLPAAMWRLRWPVAAMAIVFVYIQVQALFRMGDIDALIKAELGLAAGALAFFLAYLIGHSGRQSMRAVLWGFCLIAAAYGLYGILELRYPPGALLWYDSLLLEGVADGTFVNRNTFATYLGAGLLVAIALAMNAGGKALPRLLAGVSGKAPSIDPSLLQLLVAVLAIIIISAALFLTQSRGGVIAAAAAVCLLLLLAARTYEMSPWKVAGGALAIAAAAALMLVLFGGGLLGRIGAEGANLAGREHLFAATFQMILDRPFSGHGFGSWEITFPRYRPEALGPYPDFDKAHNVFLESWAALGLVIGTVLLTSFVWITTQLSHPAGPKRQKTSSSQLGLALLALVAIHGMIDYSVQVPGFGVSFAILIGVCVGRESRRL